jgi:hypothetical protein
MIEMSTFDSGTGSASDLSSAPSGRATLPAPSCFRINEPSVIYQTFEQEVVAVHLNTGSYHTLPGIAGEAFLLLGPAGSSAQEAAVKLAARYDATPLLIEQDLDIFISQLLEQKMIVAIETAPGYVANAAPAQPKDAEQTPQLAPYTAPRLESFSDLEGLVLIDPVHDVDTTGWPKVAPDTLIESTDGGPGESAHAVVLPLMRCRLSGPNVIFERFNTETVAMDLGTGAYHSLAGEAEEIFLLFPSEPTTWEIRDALAGKYLVEMPELEAALAEYLNQLVQEGLILLEKIEGEVTPRELQLTETPGETAERQPFHHPRIEAFAQPSFDGGFGEEMTFSHERPTPKEDPAEGTASPDPYTRRRYAVRSGDLVYSTAGGETVIADRDQGQYFKLNRAASDVFALLERRPDAGGIVAALGRRYAVREQDLRVALMILLWNLRKVGLVALEAAALEPAALEAGAPQESAPDVSGSAEAPTAELLPFTGFDVALHHDLAELLRPFNPTHGTRPAPKASFTRQFLMLLEAYFDEAASASNSSEESFEVAGEQLAIRCAGAGQTADLRRAFQHLKSTGPDARPGLTISAWNNGVVPVGPFLESTLARLYENWSILCGPRGEVLEFNCDEIAVIYHPGPDVLSVLDRANGKAFYLLRDDSPLPFWELSSPFRHILHPWFATRGLQYTHAGAVGTANGGVLLAGKGGSGKSTTSLLCASAGMLYVADDYCLTRASDGTVFSLYGTAKLKGTDDLERLPEMAGRSFNEDSFEHGGIGKGTFNLTELWPERMAPGFPVRAILLPTVTSKVDSSLEPCSPADALLALAPSTLAQLPFSDASDSHRLAALADKVPAYRLFLGSDLDQIPVLIAGLIDRLAGESAG